MQIHEVLRCTGLTRKAVEYYLSQGLVAPEARENGYRDFSEEDVRRLSAIAAYRKLGLGVAQIRDILAGKGQQTIGDLIARRSLARKIEDQKAALLARLAAGESLEALGAQLRALDAQESISARLMDAFPGYFGRYIGLHFAGFLAEPVENGEQRAAYETIVRWLDGLPPLDLPEDLRAFLEETTQEMDTAKLEDMRRAVLAASENPQAYLREHEDAIRAYMAFKESEAYKASPAARLMAHMQQFQKQSGYVDVFLPAMERLSPAYASYRARMHAADEALAAMIQPT